jgi:hypothetical protein
LQAGTGDPQVAIDERTAAELERDLRRRTRALQARAELAGSPQVRRGEPAAIDDLASPEQIDVDRLDLERDRGPIDDQEIV